MRAAVEVLAAVCLLAAPGPIVGQRAAVPAAAAAAAYRVTWGDAASVGTAGVLYLLPASLGLPHGGPSCAPCDPGTLPGVDRWALRPVSGTADVASDLVLAGVAGFSAFAGRAGVPAQRWRGNVTVLANTATWTAATTQWLKVLVRRKRPVLYTADALAAATDRLPRDRAAATSGAPVAERASLVCRCGGRWGSSGRGGQALSDGCAGRRRARQRHRVGRPDHSPDERPRPELNQEG